jgi:hypothetical protein
MKNTIITITIAMFCFGWGQSMNPSERFFSQLPQEIQDQLSQSRISWGQAPSRPITPSNRDAEGLYGEWEHEDDNATLWVTSGTDQTIPNSSQIQGQEPADGAINIDGPIPGSMNYMMNMGGMYGYDMVYIALSNNVFTDGDYWENMALPHYQLLYISYPEYSFAGGEFVIVDTMGGDFVEYFYEIEDADDQITVDETSLRINITDLTLSNDSGDSTYVLSGTLVPGTIDIEAGVSTAVSSPMFEDDFGPVSGDESMTWQLHENGTGLEIVSGEDYYDSWSDTTELQWSANDDSMTMVFLYWDDYYYEEESDTMVFAYNVENDTLSINATMDLCEMMDDDYYYGDCYEMLSMVLGIADIQEALMDFDMTMSFSRPLVPEIIVEPDTLNFGVVYTGYPDTVDLTIHNGGLAILTIEFIELYGDDFYLASDLSLPVAVTTSLSIPVGFDGSGLGDYAGTMNITSNDTSNTNIVIPMFAEVSDPPIISVSPDSLYSALLTDETETQTLQLANNGSSDLRFSINLLNVNTRPHVNIEPGNGPTLSIQDVQGFWNSDHEYSSSGSGRPGTTTPTRTTRSWQLLANDPQDNNSPYDTKNIYYEVTDTSLNFKYEYYEPWEDAEENTVAIVYLNIDNDTETGGVIEDYYGVLWEGIDAIIYSFGSDYFDGIYIYAADYYYGYPGFAFYELLSWRVAEDNTNEFSFAVSNELFQGLTSSRIASWSGSFDYDPDIVPNEGMLDLYFRPAWLSIEPLDSVITVGSALDLSVTFDATGLFGGDYHALIQINSNDPSTPELNVPARLNVTGIPDIVIDVDTLDFGVSYVGYGDEEILYIENSGTGVLEILNIESDNENLTASTTSFGIEPLQIDSISLTLLGMSGGDFTATLMVTTNDPDESTINIPVVSAVLIAPDISVDPESIIAMLAPGETITDTFYIHNTGGSDLTYDIQTISEGTAGAIDLDGSNDGLAVSDNPVLDIQNQITIETWINPSNISQNYPRIVAKGDASTNYGNFGAYELALNGETGDDNASTAFATLVDANTNEPYWVGSYSNIQFDTWTHLATTYDGTYYRFYVNGALQDEYMVYITISTNNEVLSIGKWFSGNHNSFAGQIDEVRIWDIARTGEEIVSNMNQILDGDETGLVGYWSFDIDISDQSSYQHQTNSIGNVEIVSSTSPVAGSSFLSVIPAIGTVGSGESAMATFTIQNLDEPGTHTGEILILSNDPDEPLIGMPVTIVIESLGNDDLVSLPKEFALHPNHPNPFNPVTTIRFDIPVETHHNMSLQIFDITGRMVEILVNEKLEPGQHGIQWNASQHSSGVYFLRMETSLFSKTQKMILLK